MKAAYGLIARHMTASVPKIRPPKISAAPKQRAANPVAGIESLKTLTKIPQ